MKKKILLTSVLIFSQVGLLLTTTSCSRTSKIVFANYESYFSTDLISKYQDQVSFLNYSNENDIKQKFTKNYDIAIPTTALALELLKKGELAQIDWKSFGEIAYEQYGEAYSEGLKDANGNVITCGKDAESLLATNDTGMCPAQAFISSIDTWAYENSYFPHDYLDEVGEEYSILDFIIPYFFQNFVFAYKGGDINELSDEDVSWGDINNVVGQKNETHDTRFNESNRNKVLMVDDYRTIYDIAQFSKGGTEINPPNDTTINQFNDVYNTFFEQNFSKNQLLLNSDTGVLVATFSESKNSNNGLYAYNGDTILAAIGNGEANLETYWAQEWLNYYLDSTTNEAPMSVAIPSENLIALDSVVFNKNSIKLNSDNKPDLNNVQTKLIYEFAFNTLLDHLDYADSENHPIYECDEDDNYIYDSMNNFDWVLYTSPWQQIGDYCNGTDGENDYFLELTDSYMEDLPNYEEDCNSDWAEFLKKIYTINLPLDDIINHIEQPTSDAIKSNMLWGYNEAKQKV